MLRIAAALATLLAATAAGTASAQDFTPSRFYVHAGPGYLDLDEKADMKAGGAPLPGGDVSIKPQTTAVLEAGWFVTPNVAVSFTGGVPPKAKIDAAGTLAGLGRLGEIVYGPAAVTASYHFTQMGRIQPYVGAGASFMLVFDETDGLVTDLKVDNTVGSALQIGADVMINERFGAFVDVKKAFFSTDSTGSLGPAPIEANIRLDPLVVHAGLTARF